MYLAMYEQHQETDKVKKYGWIFDRLAERSTWLGVISALAGFGIIVQPEVAGTIAGAGAILGGIISAVTKDKTVVKP
jgi:uncharacterized protein (DUF697 family)